MRFNPDPASRCLRAVYKGHLDGYSVLCWAIILLTNWARLSIWRPGDILTLSVDLLAGISASLVYVVWAMGYLHTRMDLQKRSTQSYRRLRTSAMLLGTLFMGTSLQ